MIVYGIRETSILGLNRKRNERISENMYVYFWRTLVNIFTTTASLVQIFFFISLSNTSYLRIQCILL